MSHLRHRLSAFSAFGVAVSVATAQPYFITELWDGPDLNPIVGVVDADLLTPGNQVTLRGAIQDANLQPPGTYVIDLQQQGVFLLSVAGAGEDLCATGDLDIHNGLIINGGGAGGTVIDASQIGERVFDIHGSAAVEFNNLTVTRGTVTGSTGGGVRVVNAASLTLDFVEVADCHAGNGTSNHGGGIHTNGDLLARGCFFHDCTASGFGGAIYTTGFYTRIEGCGNAANFATRFGGALRMSNTLPGAKLEAAGSFWDQNRCGSAGGAVHVNCESSFADCGFTVNDAIGVGGGINSSGLLTARNCFFIDNHTASGGGAINNAALGDMTIEDCSFVRNVSDTSGGAITNSWIMFVNRCLFEGNEAFGSGPGGQLLGGGAIYTFNVLRIVNSTLTGNNAPIGYGGAIINPQNTVEMTACTVAFNTALDGMAVWNGAGLGPGTFITTHSIFGPDLGTGVANFAGPDPVISAGYNLDSDGSGLLGGPGDIALLDPVLHPQSANGGPTLTHALDVSSPCRDAGDPVFGVIEPNGNTVTEDQRAFVRPVGVADIGAYELCCPADMNCDGVINGIDVGLFLQAYGTGNPAADFNQDGVINGIDVGLFLQHYGTGC